MSPADEARSPALNTHDLSALVAAESVRHRRRRIFLWTGLALLLAGIVAAVIVLRPRPLPPEQRFRGAPLSRGPIIRQISPVGRLDARVTVEVGAQISGRLSEVLVDYNSPVKKGQILARIDPASLSAQVDQSAASRRAARAAQKQAKLELSDAERTSTTPAPPSSSRRCGSSPPAPSSPSRAPASGSPRPTSTTP
jgi:multidrug efflux pump subunit AcrA (membrane-fusion protein)